VLDFIPKEPEDHDTRLILGRRTRKTNHNIYILGAGFSVDAGLPTIANFLNHMRDAADWLAREHRDAERAAVEEVLEFRHDAAAAGYVSFPDRLTGEGRLLRVRSGHAEVEVQ
jgi:hypothetical protein